ncbi:hypothetical protein LZ31DRAFT_636912 [Colletotrichum somersetense]|nr:hypothetical protein LZ31DRAFT_636912 [Colletotrichum somersetense]
MAARPSRDDEFEIAVGALPQNTMPNTRLVVVVLALLPKMRIAGTFAVGCLVWIRRDSSGQVVISTTVVQYDYGRQHSGRFIRRDTVDEDFGRSNKDIRSLLATFQETMSANAALYRSYIRSSRMLLERDEILP